MPSGGIEGRVVSRRGRGRSDRPQIRDPSRVSNLCSQNTGQFFSSQNEENWIDFSGLGDRFWVSQRSFLTSGGQICPLGGQFEGLGSQIRDQDPDFDLWEAKICGPKTDFPYGRANFDLWEVKTRLIWPILGLEGPKRPISGIPAWKR